MNQPPLDIEPRDGIEPDRPDVANFEFDLGGPPSDPSSPNPELPATSLNSSPATTSTPKPSLSDRLVDVKIHGQKLRYGLIIFVTGVLTVSALGCIGMSLYTGCHFIKTFEERLEKQHKYAESIDSTKKTKSTNPKEKNNKKEDKPSATAENLPNPNLVLLAPAIPALFSSTIALLLLITLARFVSNMDKTESKTNEKDDSDTFSKTDIIELVKSLKS